MIQNKVVQNAKWIIGCRVVQSLIQLVIGMLSARYLGPANYGLLNYAASVVAFFSPLMQLGLNATLVQEYVNRPTEEGKVLGTSLVMNLVSSLACVVGVTLFATIANPGDPVAVLVCVLYSLSLIVQSIEMLQYWFQAKLLSKYSSLALLVAYIVAAVYKVYLLATGKSVYWFALSFSIQSLIRVLILLLCFKKLGGQISVFSFKLAKEMYNKCKFYIFAAIMEVVYSRIGNVLLYHFWGETETGFFSVTITCAWITTFIFNAIIDSARPVVLESRKKSIDAFGRNISRVYSLINSLSIAQGVVYTLFAGLIIKWLYGEAYLPAVPVLQIMIWGSVFSYMGAVRNVWILGEEKHDILWIVNLSGMCLSIVLNLLFVPVWGACGAALASVFVQVFTNFVMGFILKAIRRNNYLLLKGFNPKLVLEMVQMVMSK